MKRKPGTPLGNQNNLKRAEVRELSQPSIGCLEEEIILLRILIDQAAAPLKPAAMSDQPLSLN